MAHFYAGVQGSRSEATRVGGKASGIRAFAQGWGIGARIRCFVGDDGEDKVMVTLYCGARSTPRAEELCLGCWKNVNGVIVPVIRETPQSLFGTWRIANGGLILEEP